MAVMENKFFIKLSLNSKDDLYRIVEKKISKCFDDFDEIIFKATMMAISELLENAIKYGLSVKEENDIGFEFICNSNITIKVMNKVEFKKNLDSAIKHIEEINSVINPEVLYVKRLNELHQQKIKDEVSQIGLYRIAYEGEFKLSYELDGMSITIIAIRDIK